MASPKIEKLAAEQGYVTLGRITGLHGVKGWVKVFSDTSPRENIVKYSPWYLYQDGKWSEREVVSGKRHGKTVIASIKGCDQREQAMLLMDTVIAVKRSQLPAATDGEYYWSDLVGMQVVNKEGVELGSVDHLFETGANDVIVVKGEKEHFVPFVQPTYVCSIDVDNRLITVDWDPDF